MNTKRLEFLLSDAASSHPHKTGLIDAYKESVTYGELNAIAAQISQSLLSAGISANDRVGICIPKSIGSVASIFGILSSRACYVPVDPGAPLQRNAFIFSDCTVKGILVHEPLAQSLCDHLQSQGVETLDLVPLNLPENKGSDILLLTVEANQEANHAQQQLAYILYTSGSTGKPKGVVHSHSTALSFVDWCSSEFLPSDADIFSSHAPFHFDLSILDLFVSIKHKATLVLIGETLGKQPMALSSIISDHKITIWYSTPSILRLLVEYGSIGEKDFSSLRLILYAGEVFPLKHLRSLWELLPDPDYYNLYGPTETNVCTFCHLPKPVPEDETLPQRIGKVCSGDTARVVDETGMDVPPGEEGELWIAGGSVHLGYWNLPERNAIAFSTDNSGQRWYKTGDLVIDQGEGDFQFIGRRDRMVKRRGFRVELGEIESVLYTHSDITEAALIANNSSDSGVQLVAYIQWSGTKEPSVLELKRFASENLVNYMIPDRFVFLESLPKTSTDKIDYQMLKGMH